MIGESLRQIHALLFALSCLILGTAASGVAIAAEGSVGVTEAEVMQALSAKGLPVRLGNDSFHEPMIESFAGGVRFYVYFYECDTSRRCTNIQFRAGFATHRTLTLERINDWSTRWRFGRLYLDPEGDAILDMDVDVKRGASADLLGTQVQRWLEVMQDAERFLGWHS